eukprot:TRINITY_DN2410_c0_g1_i1.p1 TRINITY_DN2410_c0_g1~~TRINITY_DN2410_c0_g1_i1.p1  ORF type:complete len:577 (-),score=115.40 TRINITY_DN2410_c0_g1_i1:155-1885(-)
MAAAAAAAAVAPASPSWALAQVDVPFWQRVGFRPEDVPLMLRAPVAGAALRCDRATGALATAAAPQRRHAAPPAPPKAATQLATVVALGCAPPSTAPLVCVGTGVGVSGAVDVALAWALVPVGGADQRAFYLRSQYSGRWLVVASGMAATASLQRDEWLLLPAPISANHVDYEDRTRHRRYFVQHAPTSLRLSCVQNGALRITACRSVLEEWTLQRFTPVVFLSSPKRNVQLRATQRGSVSVTCNRLFDERWVVREIDDGAVLLQSYTYGTYMLLKSPNSAVPDAPERFIIEPNSDGTCFISSPAHDIRLSLSLDAADSSRPAVVTSATRNQDDLWRIEYAPFFRRRASGIANLCAARRGLWLSLSPCGELFCQRCRSDVWRIAPVSEESGAGTCSVSSAVDDECGCCLDGFSKAVIMSEDKRKFISCRPGASTVSATTSRKAHEQWHIVDNVDGTFYIVAAGGQLLSCLSAEGAVGVADVYNADCLWTIEWLAGGAALPPLAVAASSVLASDAAAASGFDDTACVVCLSARRSVTFVHGATGHLCCCAECAERVKKNDPCPMCRQPVEVIVRTFS